MHHHLWKLMVMVCNCHNVSNALSTLVATEMPGFQVLSKGLIILLCADVVRQRVRDHEALHRNARRPTVDSRCRGTTIICCVADLRHCLPTTSVTGVQQSTRYCIALPCRHLCMMTPSLCPSHSSWTCNTSWQLHCSL